jgi:hypothetical protein
LINDLIIPFIFCKMGKNKKRKQNSPRPIPIITATRNIDGSPDTTNQVERLTIDSPAIFVETVS